MKVIMTHFLWR